MGEVPLYIDVVCSRLRWTRPETVLREIGNLLPNNRRQRRTCYALCHILCPVSAAHTSIFRMDSNSTSYQTVLTGLRPRVFLRELARKSTCIVNTACDKREGGGEKVFLIVEFIVELCRSKNYGLNFGESESTFK